ETRMWASAIVMLQPTRQHAGTICRTVVRSPVGPLAQRGLDEALGLAVRARRVGTCAAMAHAQGPTRGAEAVRTVRRSVVGQDPTDGNTERAKPAEGAPQEGPGAHGALVRQDLDVGDPGMIVDSDVQVLPPNPVVHVDVAGAAGNPVADSRDTTKLFHIEMQQIARPRVLVPLSHRWGAQAPAPRQARPAQDSRRGGGTHPDRMSNLG